MVVLLARWFMSELPPNNGSLAVSAPGASPDSARHRKRREFLMLKRYVIERDLPGVGKLSTAELGGAARTSNAALARIPGVQWEHSYVAGDKTFCIYLAESEEQIREHARTSGFPASRITEVLAVIDPTTEAHCPA
jgi:hypothetical protein